ncbi:Hypothetical protein NTJ_07134 [Nesidiocoris tenuis]|uniref:Uncharacterized protein n=1 Tax=Nesidiocoris tenuis TaxID=355587 RepID=A0ABN7AQ46_9HEMI|nr:Hypothetical protein NTJ_07134 [Nesidiocoris tenuis]
MALGRFHNRSTTVNKEYPGRILSSLSSFAGSMANAVLGKLPLVYHPFLLVVVELENKNMVEVELHCRHANLRRSVIYYPMKGGAILLSRAHPPLL